MKPRSFTFHVMIATMLVSAVSLGYMGGELYANGFCQSCDSSLPVGGCPASTAGNECRLDDACFTGKCIAPAATLGTCVWDLNFSCFKGSCPNGSCSDGSGNCRCYNSGSGC